jgi:hypothetical protein
VLRLEDCSLMSVNQSFVIHRQAIQLGRDRTVCLSATAGAAGGFNGITLADCDPADAKQRFELARGANSPLGMHVTSMPTPSECMTPNGAVVNMKTCDSETFAQDFELVSWGQRPSQSLRVYTKMVGKKSFDPGHTVAAGVSTLRGCQDACDASGTCKMLHMEGTACWLYKTGEETRRVTQAGYVIFLKEAVMPLWYLPNHRCSERYAN